MPNGKPGDHPLDDIVALGLPVYSAEADALVREIAQLVSRERLLDLFDWFRPPPLPEFTRELRELSERLRADAHERGWEV